MKSIFYVLLIAISLLSACGKYNTNFNELPSSSTDWLVPFVKGRISFNNLKALNQSTIQFSLPAADLGYATGIPITVPTITIPEIGPYAQPLSDWIHTVQFDTLQISLSFQNAFPIAIGSGTRFSFRRTPTTADPNNIIYQHDVSANIEPGAVYDFKVAVNNNAISDTLYLFLEQFTSPGAPNVTFPATPSQFKVTVDIVDLKKVEFNAGKTAVEWDTIDVNFGSGETETGPIDTSSKANVNFFIDHAMPINMAAQVYFLDPITNQISDSLLNAPINLVGCTIDANGNPTNVNSSKTAITVSSNRIDKIKQSKKAILNFRLNNLGYPGPLVPMSDKAYLDMQITGDLHLSFNLNNL